MLSAFAGRRHLSPEAGEGGGAASPDTGAGKIEGILSGSALKAVELGHRLSAFLTAEERRAILGDFGAEGPALLLELLNSQGSPYLVMKHAVALLEEMQLPHYERKIAEAKLALLHVASRHALQLIAVVEDKSLPADRRVKAVEELGSVELPLARRALERFLLHAGNPAMRAEAAESLGERRSPESVPALIDALRDEEIEVRGEVVLALGMIGPEARAAVPILNQMLQYDGLMLHEKVVEALIAIGFPPVTSAIEQLQSEDEDSQDAAARALVRVGAPAVPALIAVIKDADSDLCMRAALVLQLIKDPNAVPLLIEALKDDEAYIRVPAADALTSIGAPAMPALIDALKHENDLVGLKAVEILGAMGNPSAVPALIQNLMDPRSARYLHREKVFRALEEVREVALPALLEALKDSKSLFHERLVEALGELDDSRAVPALIETLHRAPSVAREKAARALGQIGDSAALPALIEASRDECSYVAWQAVLSLGALGPAAEAAAPRLIQIVRDETSSLQGAAALALVKVGTDDKAALRLAVCLLGEMDHPLSVPALIDAMREGDFEVRREAVRSLGKQGVQSAVPALVEALKDEHAGVRWIAVGALGKIEGPAAVAALSKGLIDDDAGVRWMAADALGRKGPAAHSALPALVRALRDEDSEVRQSAAYALGEIGDREVLPILVRSMNQERDEHTRLSMHKAIARIKHGSP